MFWHAFVSTYATVEAVDHPGMVACCKWHLLLILVARIQH